MKMEYSKNPSILNNFLYYLSGVKGFSFNTILAYNSDLNMFFYFIKEYLRIKLEVKDFNVFVLLHIKESDIIAFLVHSNFHCNNNPNTRQRKLCSIRSFYRWLLSTVPSFEIDNPAKNIGSMEKVDRLPKCLTLEQAKKIQTIFTLHNSQFPHRNNAIIALFLSTGLRVSELIHINLCDVNFDNSSIYIHYAKGNKQRVVYMNAFCKKQLKKYLSIRRKDNKVIDINEPLFLNRYHNRVGIDCIENICKKAFALIGLQNCGYTTHCLRHTATSLMYTYVKQDMLLLKKFLGHVSITSTQIYTHIFSQEVKNAVNNHPLNFTEELDSKIA